MGSCKWANSLSLSVDRNGRDDCSNCYTSAFEVFVEKRIHSPGLILTRYVAPLPKLGESDFHVDNHSNPASPDATFRIKTGGEAGERP